MSLLAHSVFRKAYQNLESCMQKKGTFEGPSSYWAHIVPCSVHQQSLNNITHYIAILNIMPSCPGWSGGAKVLGKLSVPGRPTDLDNRRARAYWACSRCEWGLFWTVFLLSIFSDFFLPLWETVLYRLKYCLKGP